MKKRIGIILICLLLIISSSAIVFPVESIKIPGNTIYVDDDNVDGPWDGTQEHPYFDIQDGINNAKNGDTVFVYNGFYCEKHLFWPIPNILINRSINLIGQNKSNTIIDGMTHTIIDLASSNVTIQSFTLQNAYNPHGSIFDTAIDATLIKPVYENITILDCDLVNNGRGICFSNNFSNLKIKNCNIYNSSSGHGISVSKVYNLIIENCQIVNNGRYQEETNSLHGGGVYVSGSKIVISKCIINNNVPTGLWINDFQSEETQNNHNEIVVQDNIINNNSICGILASNIFSDNCKFINNIIKNNGFSTIPDTDKIPTGGIYLQDIKEVYFNNNNISTNRIAVIFLRSSNIEFSENNFINNKFDSYFWEKDFFSNVIWNKNYWSDWIGIKIKVLNFLPYHLSSNLIFNFDWHPARKPYDIP